MRYPVAVVSKGRSASMQTSRALAKLDVHHYVVIEDHDLDAYRDSLETFNIRAYVTLLVLPFSNHGDGPGLARNWFWSYAKDVLKTKRFWVMDDNIKYFMRFQNRKKEIVSDSHLFNTCEDFVDRYKNIVMAGLQYSFFIVWSGKYKPYSANTRIYSCALIDVDCPFKFRGRYNEDTIISLDILKSGLCTVQFNHLLQYKARTQTVKGGNSAEFYDDEGTYPKSKMLVDTHSDVSRLAYKFQRIHHYVDYSPFKNNQFILNENTNSLDLSFEKIEKIYIPTVRRADNQITFNNLPDELKERVVMVIDPNERDLYHYQCEYLEIPKEIVGIWTQLAETRKFIHKHAGSIKYAVIDDDIIIKRRNSKYWNNVSNMDKSKRLASSAEILDMFEMFAKWLDEPDIGIVGLSDSGTPPPKVEYRDTTDVYSCVFYDGRMISKVIDDMDITSLRVAEDVLFLYEALSRGINTRKSTEWVFDNRSMVDKSLKDSRIVWKEIFEEGEEPVNYYQSDAHYDAMKYIQKKYPHGVNIFYKDGKRKNIKYLKKVYNPISR